MSEHHLSLYVNHWINTECIQSGDGLISDVGADILDLAETMIMSNGLKYEPVSTTIL